LVNTQQLLIFDADTYGENFLRSKIVCWQGGIYGLFSMPVKLFCECFDSVNLMIGITTHPDSLIDLGAI